MAYTRLDEPVQGCKSKQPAPRAPSPDDCATRCAASLDEIRTDLIVWGKRLNELVQGPAQMLVQDSLQLLADQVCRIAVIGQVKAGKSSFVNALIRRPGLLPSDVNPWTTVVTKLHFNCSDAPAGTAAAFKFFEPDEWQVIAQGGGRVRELTERLVPGFQPATLSRHLEAMRLRAESRLGREFRKLLGTTHAFPTLEQTTLERYVCAGSDGVILKSGSGAGQYSDITKTADLYFDSNDFGFPTVMIDTPGTNDPFLVRDEITRRSLEGADFHIVVLTAQQPLSTADVALLRILRGLNKERIVVFVNRIDQLTNLPEDAEMVAERVRDGLQAELPGVDVPIVLGSALWANSSLLIDQIDPSSMLSPRVIEYARHVGGNDFDGLAAGALQISTDEMARLLLACSGIPQLGERLGQSILDSQASRTIGHIAANFCDLAGMGEMSTQDEIARVEQLVQMTSTSAESRAGEAERLSVEAGRARKLSADLEQTIQELERELSDLTRTECDALSHALKETIETFSRQECARLEEIMSHGKPVRSWRCDTAAIRQQLETEYVKRFRETENRILGAEHNIFPRLRRTIAQALPEAFQEQGVGAVQPPPLSTLSLSVLSKALVFDLDYPWWLAWWKGRLSAKDRLGELDRMIRQEFLPVVDELVGTAHRHLTDQIAATLLNANVICSGIVDALRTQSEWHAAKVQELLLINAGDSADMSDEHRRNLAELREWLQKWESVGKNLGDIRDRCHQLLGGDVPLQSSGSA